MVYERDIVEALYGPWLVVGDIVEVLDRWNREEVRIGIVESFVHERIPVLISLEKGENETELECVTPSRIKSVRRSVRELRMVADLQRYYG